MSETKDVLVVKLVFAVLLEKIDSLVENEVSVEPSDVVEAFILFRSKLGELFEAA